MPEENKAAEPVKVEKSPKPGKTKKLNKKALSIILLIVLLLAGNITLAWYYKQAYDDSKQAEKQVAVLNAQVDKLTKELAEAKADSSSTEETTTSTTCTIPSATKENIEAAISSKNTAALEGYMATKVNVVFAASEKGGKVSPTQAVTDLDYVNSNAEGPWDFSLSAATIDSYKAGFYKSYFEDPVIVGKSDNDYIVAFHLDANCKIDAVFVAASAELLT